MQEDADADAKKNLCVPLQTCRSLTHLQVGVEVFLPLLQEVSVHVVEGLFPRQLEDGRQVLELEERERREENEKER